MSDLKVIFSPCNLRMENADLLGTSILSLEFTVVEYKSIWNLFAQAGIHWRIIQVHLEALF